MQNTQPVIVRDPEILGGQPSFRGTRVHFQTLLDYMKRRGGRKGLEAFLDGFPSVPRAMAIAALRETNHLDLLQ